MIHRFIYQSSPNKNHISKSLPNHLLEFNLWTPQILLDSSKPSKNTKEPLSQAAKNKVPTFHPTNPNNLPSDLEKETLNHTVNPLTRNGEIKAQISQETTNKTVLTSLGTKKPAIRAESVKNSRRYPKKKTMENLTSQNTILSSYLPLKNYIGTNAHNIKPIRQLQREKRSLKSAISDRKGLKTTKNNNKRDSETFDDFVTRMKNETQPGERQTKQRPYTSSGYAQFRIKNSKRSGTRTRAIGKRYEALKKGPYFHNRVYLPQKMKKKIQNRQIGFRQNVLNNSESGSMNYRQTFYPESMTSLVNKTAASNEQILKAKKSDIQTNYGERTGKLPKFIC